MVKYEKKKRSPASGTIIYAVNVNQMCEHHLDSAVLIRQAAGDIFMTRSSHYLCTPSRRKDHDAVLIGELFQSIVISSIQH